MDYWGTDTASTEGITSSTLPAIAEDYNFPLSYLADVCLRCVR